MAFAGRELVDPRGQHLLARIPQPAHRAARAPPVRQVMVHRGALLLRRVARLPLPARRRHARPLLLEPVAMPHARRLPTGITQLTDHIRSAALVPHIQLNRTPTLLLAVLRHGRFLLGS